MGMRKGRGRLFELTDDGQGTPINRKVTAQLRQLILDGAISAGARLPSQRLLAKDFRVSRNTIISALQQLLSEGLVEARVGSGTYVARDAVPFAGAAKPSVTSRQSPRPAQVQPLEVGFGDMDLFPLADWARVEAETWKRMPRAALEGCDPAGWRGLRELIAARVSATRGLACNADQVIVLPSTASAIDLVARSVATQGAIAWVEDPGYGPARTALRSAGLDIRAVPVDEHGFDVTHAHKAGEAKLAYVTPNLQFPTGAVMAPQRRKSLLGWANANDAWIIEDDYDCDFIFGGRSVAALAADQHAGRVFYVGTLNTTLFATLNVTYLILPEGALDLVLSRVANVRAANIPQQVVLQAFMEQGRLAAHVRFCRDVFGERRATLLEALKARLGSEFKVTAPATGRVVQAWCRNGPTDAQIRAAAAERGLTVSAMSDHAELPCRQGLFLGFAPYAPNVIRRAVDQLTDVMSALTMRAEI